MLASIFHFNNILKAHIAVRGMFTPHALAQNATWHPAIFFFLLHFYKIEASGRLLCFFIFMSTLWTWAGAGACHLVSCHLFLFDLFEWTRRMSLLRAWQLQTAEGFVCSIKGFALLIPVGIMNKAKNGWGDARADLDWDAQTATSAACGWAALFVCRCALRWVHKADLLTYLCYMLPPEGFDSCWNSWNERGRSCKQSQELSWWPEFEFQQPSDRTESPQKHTLCLCFSVCALQPRRSCQWYSAQSFSCRTGW